MQRTATRLFRLGLVVLAAGIGASSALSQSPVEIVDVSGIAAIGNDVAQARDEAVRDALRTAVERVAGVLVESRTLMVDLAVVEDRISSRASGFVESYEVVDERRDGDVYRVQIRASVVPNDVLDELESLGIVLRTSLGNPRLLVVTLGPRDAASVADSTATNLFVDRGFFVVDAVQMGIRDAIDGVDLDIGEMVALARREGVDVIVQIDVAPRVVGERETASGTVHFVRTGIDIRAILASTAQVVGSSREEATGASLSVPDATAAATSEALNGVLEPFMLTMVGSLNQAARDDASNVSIRVVATGIMDFDVVTALQELLRTARGVVGVQLRRFDNGVADFDIQGTIQASELAGLLASSSDLDASIVFLDRQRVEVELGAP